MANAALRRSGGSLILTIPPAYIEQNHLSPGSLLSFEIKGKQLTLEAAKPRPNLRVLLAATPADLDRAEGWDDMPPVGGEL